MKRLAAALSLLALALPLGLTAACWEQADAPADVCAEAKQRFNSCGTSVPLLTDGPCNGTTKMFARCVAEHAKDCDELATLFGRIDECVDALLDGGDDLLPPADDLPLPDRDGGRDARADGAAIDASPRPPTDAGPDAPVVVDAGPVDSGPTGPTAWAGLDTTVTLADQEERRFETPSLPAGSYVFTLSGTGDGDLYVRRAAPPTTASYDCRPFKNGSSETCTVTLTAPTVIHVMLRGETTTSTVRLLAQP